MILLIDTSTMLCRIRLMDGEWAHDDEWEAGRNLAKGLLGHLDDLLRSQGKSWQDISAIGAFEGPGSFTGLRIGLTVANTIADAQNIPIVGARGEDWQRMALEKISAGVNEKLVMPYYGAEAHITAPKK